MEKGGEVHDRLSFKEKPSCITKIYFGSGKNRRALFTSKEGIRLKYGGLRAMLRRRCMRAKVANQTAHSFSRLFALTMLRNGADIFFADVNGARRFTSVTKIFKFSKF